jgi:hypothetical protein
VRLGVSVTVGESVGEAVSVGDGVGVSLGKGEAVGERGALGVVFVAVGCSGLIVGAQLTANNIRTASATSGSSVLGEAIL